MNLCHPDGKRSCAACCGLYNVRDGTRSTLSNKLEQHTVLFGTVERSAAAICEYKSRVATEEENFPLDAEIHVCEFIGFLDPQQCLVGCMLHPAAKGNEEIDFRGLCHYGSMACKSFFCPAWEEVPARYRDILLALVEDWHLYGLVMTDVDFVMSLFGLVEQRLGRPLDAAELTNTPAGSILSEILSWKDSWPPGRESRVRQSRYYFKSPFHRLNPDFDANMARFLGTLNFTFDIEVDLQSAGSSVLPKLEELIEAYEGVSNRWSG
jgi:hypothetical protein